MSRASEHRNYIVTSGTVVPLRCLVVHFTLTVASELRRSNPGLREIGYLSSPLRQAVIITLCCLEPFAVSIHLLRLVASAAVFCYPAVKLLTPPSLRAGGVMC